MRAVVDNDVLFKVACYAITDEVLLTYVAGPIGYLAVARFVLPRKLARVALRTSRANAEASLTACLERCQELEPSRSEQELAADLELAAQRAGLRLDVGESQLCAISIRRDIGMLLTGDKRGIVAIDRLVDAHVEIRALGGRIHCLEQLVGSALRRSGFDRIHRAVCSEPDVDRALTICFACGGGETGLDNVLAGLESYINALRAKARGVLST
jgi:hypothetical protein